MNAVMPSTASLWTGRILHGLVVLALLADAGVQFLRPEVNREPMAMIGMPMSIVPLLATIVLLCAVLYAIPRTAVLGAILTTGYMGGAICSNLRVGVSLSPPVIVCLLLGIMAWGGLYLSDPEMRRLLPLRR